jgi:uncharacterized membrane protein
MRLSVSSTSLVSTLALLLLLHSPKRASGNSCGYRSVKLRPPTTAWLARFRQRRAPKTTTFEEEKVALVHPTPELHSSHGVTIPQPFVTKKNQAKVLVSSSIELPFDIETAFDAFADVTRQPTWSPWLHQVVYIDCDDDDTKSNLYKESLWKIRALGLTISWRAKNTPATQRPTVIEWESTKGLKNGGIVKFHPLDSDRTLMSLEMTFRAPAIVRGSSFLVGFIEQQMLRPTLRNFRQVIVTQDLQRDA